MKQQIESNFTYPFGNPQSEQSEDNQSYHSITVDDKKLRYFNQETQKSFSKNSENTSRKKSALPPVYPYEEMKKLKQSLRLQKNPAQGFDTQSVRSVDSFHTANEFQSICYEDGDFQKMVQDMNQSKKQDLKDKNKNDHQDILIKQSDLGGHSFKHSRQGSNQSQSVKLDVSDKVDKKEQLTVSMKRSNVLDDANFQGLQKLQNSQVEEQKYEPFDEKGFSESKKQPQIESRNQPQLQEEEKSVQISQIQRVLNESYHVDQQILQLTQELQRIHSSQQEMQSQSKITQQWIKSQQLLAQRYQIIQKKVVYLQETQKNFTSQITNMSELMKKTKDTNNYLKKEIQFFKLKSKELQEKQKIDQTKQKIIEQKGKQLKENQIISSQNSSFSLSQGKVKCKTYNLRPKAPNNGSLQSRKYKQVTFEYCLGMQQLNEQKWLDLQIDSENSPPEYKLSYSFQQQNTVLVVRLMDLISNQQSRVTSSIKKPSSAPTVKKNYQYLMDFAHTKYESKQQKIQSLTKQLIIHLSENQYQCKMFKKNIEVFLIISQEEVYVDLVKIVPLPNPLAFYFESRFDRLLEKNQKKSNPSQFPKQKSGQNQNQNPSCLKQSQPRNPSIFKNIQNLHRYMKTYVIKIEQMADVESIQKLISLWWVNTTSTQQTKYFSIKSQSNSVNSNQLFYVKIEDCILQNGPDHQKMDLKYRYSLAFKVASTYDNPLLVELIQFLTFLTVI